MSFVAIAMKMLAESIFGCSALVAELPCELGLLEETLAFMANLADPHDLLPLEVRA